MMCCVCINLSALLKVFGIIRTLFLMTKYDGVFDIIEKQCDGVFYQSSGSRYPEPI